MRCDSVGAGAVRKRLEWLSRRQSRVPLVHRETPLEFQPTGWEYATVLFDKEDQVRKGRMLVSSLESLPTY